MTEQQALSAFQDVASETSETPSTGGSPSQTRTFSVSEQQETGHGGPLDSFYEDVIEEANRYPDALRDLRITVPLEPPAGGFVTNNLPEGIDALPMSIGNWKLATRGDDHLIYAADGRAFDERWGDGGAIHRVRVNLNDRGANRDDLYHRSSETLVGYTNGKQIRNASADDSGPLLSVPGHSVQNNKGDHACLHGTAHKSETRYEAAVDLIAYLHFTPTPLANYVPLEPETGWKLTMIEPRTASWQASAPNEIPKDHLRLSLTPSRITLQAFDPEDSLPDRDSVPVPSFDALPESAFSSEETSTTLPALSAGVILAREIVSHTPAAVVSASALPE